MKLKLTVDGKVYEVDVEVDEQSPRPAFVPPPGHVRTSAEAPPAKDAEASGGQEVSDESKVCRSPMSGVIVRMTAQIGQEIGTSDTLMVIEAMKMETEITSPKSGKIAKIHAAPGDSVKAGQVLVELE